jgi:hypothetical protein
MRVLAVDLNQQLPQLAQLRKRNCRAIDKTTRAPVAADNAAK